MGDWSVSPSVAWFAHPWSSDSSLNIHNALYFVKYPCRAAQNSPEGSGLKTPVPEHYLRLLKIELIWLSHILHLHAMYQADFEESFKKWVCPALVSGRFWQFWIIEHQMILYMYDLRSIFYYEYIHHYISFIISISLKCSHWYMGGNCESNFR